MLGELERSPEVATLAALVERGLDRALAEDASGDAEPLPAVLDRLRQATVALYREPPLRVSWDALMLRGSAIDPTTRYVLIVEPRLDFDALLPASPALQEIRRAAREAGLVPERGVRVRITGYPALNDEEMRGLATDVGVAGVASFLIVLAILGGVFRRARMVAAAGATLVVGLVWSAAFAAAAVGQLNLVSISFAVLFIGLGVDFTIHLGLHVIEARQAGHAPVAALREAAADVGGPLTTCAVTTAVGCFAFVPTDYKGVAELGLVTGVGLFLILLLTLTFFPALLAGPLRDEAPVPAPHRAPAVGRLLRSGILRHPGRVCVLAVLAGLAALPLLPRARFDSNVVRMRNPDTESVRTFDDLLESGEDSPWYVDVVARSPEEARALAARLDALPEVESTLTLADYVPEDQETKRAILADVAFLLDVPPAPARADAGLSVERQLAALRSLHRALGRADLDEAPTRLRDSARMLRRALGRLLADVEAGADPAAALAALEESLFAGLPDQLARLRRALEPGRVEVGDLPGSLRRRMQAPDGS
ncbi:MAG: MMPL family transporter, partial [Myxococcota bacterium]|nr:MMPL family transporter [Myxococcota bacterium]